MRKKLLAAEKKLKELENSNKNKELFALRKNAEDTQKEIREKEKEVQRIFSAIERPLRKYEHSNIEKSIENYLKNPVTALKADKELHIARVLENMLEKLSKLGLKGIQEEKARKDLTAMNKGKIIAYRNELLELDEKNEKIRKELSEKTIEQEIKKQGIEVQNLQSANKHVEEELTHLKKKTGTDTPKKIKEQIKELLEEININLVS